MKKRRTWKILEWSNRPPGAQATTVEMECPKCGHEADLEVIGTPIVGLELGFVFEGGNGSIPDLIQCRKCRRIYEK